jgi:hypothetical protein
MANEFHAISRLKIAAGTRLPGCEKTWLPKS